MSSEDFDRETVQCPHRDDGACMSCIREADARGEFATDGGEQQSQPRRVCAWCGDATGESYVSVKHYRPASADERWFCSNECALRWFDDE